MRSVECEVWSVKFEVWSANSAVCSVRCGVSREGHGRDRLSLNYRSFMFGKLPPPACPGLCYTIINMIRSLRLQVGSRGLQLGDLWPSVAHLLWAGSKHAPAFRWWTPSTACEADEAGFSPNYGNAIGMPLNAIGMPLNAYDFH